MKNLIKVLVVLTCFVLMAAIGMQTNSNKDVIATPVKSEPIVKLSKKDSAELALHNKHIALQTKIGINRKGDLSKFLNGLSWVESGHDWTISNRFGYVGKYQIGKLAFLDLGYELDIDSFKVNPTVFPEEVQDSLVIELLKLNRSRLSSYINKHSGTYVNGIYVTKSGILASAHLVGSSGVIRWLDSKGKIIPKDGNGASMEYYMVKFSNYTLKL